MLRLFVIAALAISFSASAAEKKLYRYKDNHGVMATTTYLPPEYSSKGYDVIDDSGRVIKTVAPALTEEQKEKFLLEEKQRNFDKELLIRYSRIEEIEAIQKRKKDELDVRIRILENSRDSLKKQIKDNQEKAAQIERSGGVVPDYLVKGITKIQAELMSTEEQIAQRRADQEEQKKLFSFEIERFKIITKTRKPGDDTAATENAQ